MNLDELRTVQSKERQKDSLQHLRPSFYREVGEYVAELEAERDRVAEAADDPFSAPEVGRLTDEIETAKDVVEAIYERRMGKLVKQASLAAAGMPADDEGLTAEEADLFEDLVDRIRSNKGRVLDVLDGEVADVDASTDAGAGDDPGAGAADAGAPDAPSPDRDAPPVPPEEPPADADRPGGRSEPDAPPSGVSAADVMGGDGPPGGDPGASAEPAPGEGAADGGRDDVDGEGEHEDGDAAESDVERVTVRITRDVGSILGVDDREYTLAADDVVTLPEPNAEPLLEREAAEPLE
ncbi:hypothetical protein [Salinilacihabitans rarus]|uniref:hypothetical protein n=1 Tax=Salinilacihabitans rarus TaxID=2961596 RepID=UPI0020C8E744|nr:hypothetical protein [Salinilacihabitans rarus]